MRPPLARPRHVLLLATGTGALAVLVVFGVWLYQELRFRLRVKDAREAILAAESLITEPPRGLEKLLASKEAGYPVFVELLSEEDPVVWTRTLQVLDMWHEDARKPEWGVLSRFQIHLRNADLSAWVKYQLPGCYKHSTEWRVAGDILAPEYWSGWPGGTLDPDSRLLRFLRGFLHGAGDEAFQGDAYILTPHDRRELEERAVWALRAMLHAGPKEHRQFSDDQLQGLEHEAFKLLLDVAATHRFPSVRLAALSTLALLWDPFAEGESCFGSDCRVWRFDSPPIYLDSLRWRATEHEGAPAEEFHLEHQLELLAHLDSAAALWVLVKLRQEPRFREAVAAALTVERGRWPVPKPEWLPLEAAAERFLASRDLNERAIAILVFVEIESGAAREALAAHEDREAHPELRLLARSGLAALGDDRYLPAVERELAGRLDVFFPSRRPLEAEGFYGDPRPAAAPLRARVADLARHLLQAGSRSALEGIVVHLMKEEDFELTEIVAEFIEGAPLPKASLRTGLSGDIEYAQPAFREWWQANAERFEWDPGSRRFKVPHTDDEEE